MFYCVVSMLSLDVSICAAVQLFLPVQLVVLFLLGVAFPLVLPVLHLEKTRLVLRFCVSFLRECMVMMVL